MIKGNQPTLLETVAQALAGPDEDFADTTWTEEGAGHGRREQRGIRTAPATGIAWPHAAQVFRIRRDTGPTHGPWTRKEIAFGITSLPAALAGPRHLGIYARRHWAIENREHRASETLRRFMTLRPRCGYGPRACWAWRQRLSC